MHDHEPILAGRLQRHLAERIIPAATEHVADLQVRVHRVTDPDDSPNPNAIPGVPGQGEPITFAEAIQRDYEPLAVGEYWGSPWGTSWLEVTGTTPADDGPFEAVVELGWKQHSPGFQSEGLVFRPDGSIVKALNPFNSWIPVAPGEVHLFVEAAANPILLDVHPFVPTEDGDKLTATQQPIHTLSRAEVVRVHPEVRALAADLVALDGLARELPSDSGRRWQLRVGIDHALDALDLDDIPGTAMAAREVLAPLLAAPATSSAHQLSAVGHAHIDSGWLCPMRETRRKVARTVANQLNLLQSYPEHLFVLPAAQHVAWIEQDQPELFARLQEAVAAGRVIPTGSMWVETDAVLPGGESFCRQFVEGVGYFADKLGRRCHEVWLPDSFGYSASLPQIARLAGARWFLTQKISWNQVDTFPHHSFWWEGIDGTRIFTHFPPCDTYNGDLSAAQLAHAERNFADKGRANRSLMPFGYGDGGGGPTREMLEQGRRVANLEGSPRVVIEEPDVFFERAEAEYHDAGTWAGELYLELHRGTFTSQHGVKEGNRRSEHLLRTAEWWATTATVRTGCPYPASELKELWRKALLCQFHDVLPGSSVAWVYRESAQMFTEIADGCRRIVDDALTALGLDHVSCDIDGRAGSGDASAEAPTLLVCNASPVSIDGVVPGAVGRPVGSAGSAPRVESAEGCHVITNDHVRITVDGRGLVTSLVDLAADREVIPAGQAGNLLQLHQDFPNMWDAWDVDPFYRNTVTDLDDPIDLRIAATDDEVVVQVGRRTKRSTMTQELRIGRGREVRVSVDVDWHEKDRMLKLAWPVDVHSTSAAFEIQMGHLERPVHTNTSWDAFRYEVNAQRWVHVAEPGYGVGIANASTYGWDVTRHPRAEHNGGTYQVVRASLLRAPKYPDPRADMGPHHLEFVITPGASLEETIASGYRLNMPVVRAAGEEVAPLVTLGQGALIEALKLAEDGSGDVVVRLYEPLGRRALTHLTTGFPLAGAVETDLLEEALGESSPVAPSAIATVEGDRIGLALRPFQIVTLRLRAGDRR